MRRIRGPFVLLGVALLLGCTTGLSHPPRSDDAGADAAREAGFDPPDERYDAGLDPYDGAGDPPDDADEFPFDAATDDAATDDAATDDASAPRDAAVRDATRPPDPPAGPVERSYRVLHWNVAGVKIHDGRIDTGLLRVIQAAARDHDAQFIGLNELCRSQFDALVRALRASNWPRDPQNFARFSESRGANTVTRACGAFGDAIFSRIPIGAAARFELPSDGSIERRFLTCAPLVELPHMRFCTTHLTFQLADGRNLRQLREVFERLEAYRSAGHTTLVTGDFNTEPDAPSMDAVYASAVDTPNNRGNTGEYRELDDDDPDHCRGYGEATGEHVGGGACGGGRKIDYIFVRRDRIVRTASTSDADYAADSRPVTRGCSAPGTNLCSDHRMLVGRVTVRVER